MLKLVRELELIFATRIRKHIREGNAVNFVATIFREDMIKVVFGEGGSLEDEDKPRFQMFYSYSKQPRHITPPSREVWEKEFSLTLADIR